MTPFWEVPVRKVIPPRQVAHTANGDPTGEEAVAVGMRLALLIGIVDDLSVRPAESGPGTEVLMSWPTRHGRNGSR